MIHIGWFRSLRRSQNISRDYTSMQVHGLIPAQMMVYNWHYFIIEIIYSYISISVVWEYPDVSITESEFLHICSKNNS